MESMPQLAADEFTCLLLGLLLLLLLAVSLGQFAHGVQLAGAARDLCDGTRGQHYGRGAARVSQLIQPAGTWTVEPALRTGTHLSCQLR